MFFSKYFVTLSPNTKNAIIFAGKNEKTETYSLVAGHPNGGSLCTLVF
jgi:hypothetical protein